MLRGNHMPYMGPTVTLPTLPQPKLVLDLATPEGCKAELAWVIFPRQFTLQRTVTYLSVMAGVELKVP